uniref:Hsp20 family protein n=1 Tax=Coprococcus catus TaxID=116085 RepID=UPI0022E6D83B|nr:Hsp20 family protein [Coprococcus catus]
MIAVKVQDKLQKYVVPFYADNRAVDQTEKKLYGHHAANLMKTDIKELNNGYLTVSAAKGLDEDKEDKKTGKYIRRERYAGACQRSYYVGEDITEEDIKATFEHGILTLFVPKKEVKPAVEEKKYISIQ